MGLAVHKLLSHPSLEKLLADVPFEEMPMGVSVVSHGYGKPERWEKHLEGYKQMTITMMQDIQI